MTHQDVITNTYSPDADLRELLEDVQRNTTTNCTYSEQNQTQSASIRVDWYNYSYEGYEIPVSMAITGDGILYIFEKDQGMAAAEILAKALKLGKPTVIYEVPGEFEFHDLVAEWHVEENTRKDLTINRLSRKIRDNKTNEYTLETMERWANHWLSLE